MKFWEGVSAVLLAIVALLAVSDYAHFYFHRPIWSTSSDNVVANLLVAILLIVSSRKG